MLAIAVRERDLGNVDDAAETMKQAAEIARTFKGAYGPVFIAHGANGGYSTLPAEAGRWRACLVVARAYAAVANPAETRRMVDLALENGPAETKLRQFNTITVESASALAAVGLLDESARIAGRLDPSDALEAVCALAAARAKAGEFDEALQTVNSIDDPGWKAQGLICLLPAAPHDQIEKLARAAEDSLSKMKAGQEEMPYDEERHYSWNLERLAEFQALNGNIDGALRLIETHAPLGGGIPYYAAMACAQSGDIAGAIRAADLFAKDISPRFLRFGLQRVLRTVARTAAASGNQTQAEAWFAAIPSDEDRLFVALGLAEGLLERAKLLIPE